MSTGAHQPFDPARYASLTAALKLDLADEELVSCLLVAADIDPVDIGGEGATSQTVTVLEVLQKISTNAASLQALRVLEDEYQRLIKESHEPGRVTLNLIDLWVIDTRTGALTRTRGYLTDNYRGGSYLVEDGQSFTIKRGGEGYSEIVFASPTAAADWLTRWTDSARKKLQQAYGALETLAEEVKPAKAKR